MKPRLSAALKCLLCLLAAAALLYAGRVAAYFLISRLFTAMNMSADTYASAPVWLKYVWNRTGDIANLTALMLCFGGLMYLRTLFKPEREVLMGTHLFLGLMGAFVGLMLVRLFESADCIRSGLSGSSDALDWITDAFICVCCAVLLRGCCVSAVNAGFGLVAACAVSAVLQAVVFSLALGEVNAVLTVNGLITGAAFAYIFIRHRSLFPEILMCAGMRLGARRLMGFPDVTRYPVSENLLTGGHAGLEASLALTLTFALAGLMFVLIKKKGKSDGKKAAVSGKSLRGSKKG